MKNGIRLSALGGVVLASALALSACGSDDNGGTTAAPAGGDANCVKATVNAAGSSAQKNAVEAWTNGYSATCDGAVLNYNPAGSGAGIQAFTQKQAAFAGSDSALKPEEVDPAKARCGGNTPLNLPMVVGPVGVVYNVKGVSDLQLSPKTLALIFTGKVKTWNAPEIAAENKGATLPSTAIKPVYRSDESGTTDNFTKYLGVTAKDQWSYEHAKVWPSAIAGAGQGAAKSDGVSTVVKQTDGSISYVELSYVTNNQLSAVKVQNGNGEYVAVSPEAASKTIEGAAVKGTGNDLALDIDYATKTPGAYPIVLVTYEIACEKGLEGDQAKFVKSFLTYTASDAGQAELVKIGYAPIPASLITKVRASVAALS
ncbi:phosphate ABC transporter substrate-binding protein PstS [Actinocorallia longicatena]|uniref:Phosphate-binding protein n=1 Tax=Actinocorallia longicatena TaxID=111803 RepID=A0ABP6QNF2_9ACTN